MWVGIRCVSQVFPIKLWALDLHFHSAGTHLSSWFSVVRLVSVRFYVDFGMISETWLKQTDRCPGASPQTTLGSSWTPKKEWHADPGFCGSVWRCESWTKPVFKAGEKKHLNSLWVSKGRLSLTLLPVQLHGLVQKLDCWNNSSAQNPRLSRALGVMDSAFGTLGTTAYRRSTQMPGGNFSIFLLRPSALGTHREPLWFGCESWNKAGKWSQAVRLF